MLISLRIKIFLLFIIVVSALFWSGCGSKHPSDKELLGNFIKNKADFILLLQMFQKDERLHRVGKDFVRPRDLSRIEIPEVRINAYRKLFKKLNIPDGIEGYGKKDIIWFHASCSGLSISGSKKGYVYSKDPGKYGYGTIVEDLDTYWVEESFTAFRRIEGNWYLYFDYED